ncbi:MAG: Gfo/Idh/MocA family oxidoreductase [Gemmataceae bacterium]
MTPHVSSPSRRDFLSTAAAASTLAAAAAIPAHAQGSDTLRVGLVGCGGRGNGAAANALRADRGATLYAVADAFPNKIQGCLNTLKNEFTSASAHKVDVPPERQFSGLDAYKKVIDNCDVVCLCTPPGFRPMMLRAAVEAGKHVFCEKPMAVDAPGVRSVLESAKIAKAKGKCLVSGFCYRYETEKRETVKRIHEGAIGDVLAIHCNYNTGYVGVPTPQKEGMGDFEWQLRNWWFFTWLSGDHIVEQHIHNLDKAAWVLKDTYPIAATGLGGRQVRTDPKFGHIFDHHAVIFEYAGGQKVFSYCRQQNNCANDVSDHIFGTSGVAYLNESGRRGGHRIEGPKAWKYAGPKTNMYDLEHEALFAAIRSGNLINDGEFMAKSTMMGILGRMTTYTGQRITWEQAMASKEDLVSDKVLNMGTKLEVPPVAKPGVTKFV